MEGLGAVDLSSNFHSEKDHFHVWSGFGVKMWTFQPLWICDCIDKWHFEWSQQNKLFFPLLIGTVLMGAFVLFIWFSHSPPTISYGGFRYRREVGQSRAAVETSRPQKSGIASETQRNIWCIPLQLGSRIFQLCSQLHDCTFWILESRRSLEVGIQCDRHVHPLHFAKHSSANLGLTLCSRTAAWGIVL